MAASWFRRAELLVEGIIGIMEHLCGTLEFGPVVQMWIRSVHHIVQLSRSVLAILVKFYIGNIDVK